MLNRNLKWAICLLIVLFSGVLSFADELPPVTIVTTSGDKVEIDSFNRSHSVWIEYEIRLNTANDDMEELEDDLADIEAEIKEKEKAGKVAKGVVTLVAGKQLRASAGVIPLINWTGGSAMYDLELQRIDKYAEIHSQNELISNAFSDRETFYFEYVRRWEHHNSQSARSRINTKKIVPVPPSVAGCQNACGVFWLWYDTAYSSYYSGFDYNVFQGGITAHISSLSVLARSGHRSTCSGKESCGVGYWTCEGNEKGGTALHKLRTCYIKGRKWNSGTASYEIVTCGMPYRNCDNPGGRCFKGKVVGNDKHNDDVSVHNSYVSVSPPKSGSLSGSSSASAGGSVTIGLSTTTAFRSVYWYVAGPGESGLGSHVETDTGSSSSTTESFTYTFASDATSGDWTITAYIYNYSDSSTYQTSSTVSVSGSRYTVSDNTPNCSDCTSHCSSPCSCTNSGTCGGTVTDNTPNCSYCTDGCSSCPGSYTPPTTPSTPTTVACGGASWTGCADSVSSRTQHKVSSCSNCGKHYWTCSPTASRHTEVLTCKRTDCGASLTRCQNGPTKCDGKYHWL